MQLIGLVPMETDDKTSSTVCSIGTKPATSIIVHKYHEAEMTKDVPIYLTYYSSVHLATYNILLFSMNEQ